MYMSSANFHFLPFLSLKTPVGYQGDNLRFREHRKLISGRLSGRKRAEQLDSDDVTSSALSVYGSSAANDATMDATASGGYASDAAAGMAEKAKFAVPPLRGAGEGDDVEMEWWDEAFLTKSMRDDKVYML